MISQDKTIVTIAIDSIDFVDSEEKHIHVQNASELEKYIESHGELDVCVLTSR